MENDANIEVVYLAWLPYGIDLFMQFIDSYIKNDAGHPHRLYIVYNGVNNMNEISSYISYAKEKNVDFTYLVLKKGQDIDAYFWAAKQLSGKYLLFLNSFSEIKVSNWLRFYADVVSKTKSIISATGSLQSHYSLVFQKYSLWYEFDKSLSYNFRKYKLFIKAIFYWRLIFKPFPNPHLRTNAFLVDRKDFISIYPGTVVSKFMAYKFESGKNSLTNQFLKKGYKAFVIDRYGHAFEYEQWAQSKTFWIAKQDNLIISDNQTKRYDNAPTEEKKELIKAAWGDHV